MKRTALKNDIPGNPSSSIALPTVANSEHSTLVDIANRIGVSSSNVNGMHNMVTVVKALDSARASLFVESKNDKNMSMPACTERFSQEVEAFDENISDNENDDHLILDTSPSKTKLNRSGGNKIVKLCSPVFRVELAKKRGRPPKKKVLS